MAATNFTPISLYYSTTASAVPTSGNLVAGELALNTVDEKLYFKNSAGTVKLLAANITPVANGGTGQTSYTNGQLLIGNTTGNTLTKATLTAGSGISITNGTGSITIASTASVAAATPTALGTVYGRTPSSSADGVHLGYNSGTNFSGTNSVGIGPSVLSSASYTGTQNIAIGWTSMTGTTSGSYNVGVGWGSLSAMTTGDFNVGVGRVSLYSLTTGSQNVGIGNGALQYVTTGGSNTAVGNNALNVNTANNNTAVGHSALSANTTGARNVALGALALDSNITGDNSVAIGYNAMSSTTANAGSIAIGYNAAYQYTGTNGFIAIGDGAFSNTGGIVESIGIGASVGSGMTSGQWNVIIGHNAATGGRSASSNNIAIGYASLVAGTGGSNVAIGKQAMGGFSGTTYANNIGIGELSLGQLTSGSTNVGVGNYTLYSASTAGSNTAVGVYAGINVTTGTNNVLIGYQSGASGTNDLTTGSNNVVIGYNATVSTPTVSNEFTHGNSSITSNRFWGDFKMGGSNAGTSGQVLTSGGSGTAPSWSTPASNLVLISTTTASGATSASIALGTNGGTYSQYRIVCNNFVTNNSNVVPALRLATPTTPITSGYNSGGFSPSGANQYVNRRNTNWFFLTDYFVGTVLTGSLVIDITTPPSGQYGVGIFASSTFDYGSDGVGMSTSNYVGGIGLNGSSNISVIIGDQNGNSSWLTGTFKLYGVKA